jgi:histidinol-phosphate aminotransferase
MSLARKLARPCVLEARPYTWVRPVDPGRLLLLDANENAWEPQGRPLGADLSRYPQLQQEQLRAAIAVYAGVQPTQVLATCGADEGIDLLVKTFCEPGQDSVAVLAPAYPMYARQAAISGVQVRDLSEALWESGDALAEARDLADARLTFLSRPNNPTGRMLPRRALQALLGAVPGFLVVDEAYIEFSDERTGVADWVGQDPRLIVLRTMSKAFGLAGARVGYLLADAETIDVLDLVRLPFNVGALAAKVATAALADMSGLRRCVQAVHAERERMSRELERLPGFEVVPSQANFLLVKTSAASELCQALRQRGILVRDRSRVPACGDSFRVSVGRPEDNDRFLAALGACLEPNP